MVSDTAELWVSVIGARFARCKDLASVFPGESFVVAVCYADGAPSWTTSALIWPAREKTTIDIRLHSGKFQRIECCLTDQ